MREKARKGGLRSKPVSLGTNGMPDRMVLLSAGSFLWKSKLQGRSQGDKAFTLAFGVPILDDPAQIQK